mgnify:CR=1 FL=1
MKRSLEINYNNDKESQELVIGKALSVKSSDEFIILEKMPSGQWKLIFSESLVDDFSIIDNFKMIREN